MKRKITLLIIAGLFIWLGLSNASLGVKISNNSNKDVNDFAECKINIEAASSCSAHSYLPNPAPYGDYKSVLKVTYTADPHSGWEYDGQWKCKVFLRVEGNEIIFFDEIMDFKFDKNNEPTDLNIPVTKFVPPGVGEGSIHVEYYFVTKEDGQEIDFDSGSMTIPIISQYFPRIRIFENNPNLFSIFFKFLKIIFPFY